MQHKKVLFFSHSRSLLYVRLHSSYTLQHKNRLFLGRFLLLLSYLFLTFLSLQSLTRNKVLSRKYRTMSFENKPSYSLVGIKYNFVHATLHLITYILNKVNNTNQTKKVMIHTRAAKEAMTQSCSSSTQLMSQVHKMILLR